MYFLIKKNTNGIIILFTVSIISDLFQIPFTFKIPFYQLIAIIFSPITFKYHYKNTIYNNCIKNIYYEFFILIVVGLLFGILFPWRGEYDYLRLWTQRSEGKTIITLIRVYSEISTIMLIGYWLGSKKIDLNKFINQIAIIISTIVLLSIIDVLTGYKIRILLFGDYARIISSRFISFNYEPRAFGQTCSFVMLILFIYNTKTKWCRIGIFSSCLGVILSLSASTYIITFTWLFIYFIFTRQVKKIIITSLLISMPFYFVSESDIFTNSTTQKIKIITNQNQSLERVNQEEPDIFTKFEIFDRAALNFLYKNPLYLLFGVGPNLISIPASQYITYTDYLVYGNNLNSPPHSFFVNVLSRSGIIGLLMWILFELSLLYKVKKISKNLAIFTLCSFIINMMVMSGLYYMFIGIIIFEINKYKNYVKYSNSSIEWRKVH